MSNITKILESKAFIYLLLSTVFFIPLYKPLALPVPISNGAKDFYKSIESLPEGSYIWVSCDLNAQDYGEHVPTEKAFFKYALSRNFKVIFFEFLWSMQGSLLTHQMIEEVKAEGYLDQLNKKYGVDYVHLGWQPGWESGVAQIAQNFKENIQSTDYYQNPVKGMPILEPVNTVKDIDLVFVMTGVSDGIEIYLRQLRIPYGTRIVLACGANQALEWLPYYNSGQLEGFVSSISGGSELEFLTKFPDKAIKASDILSTTHITFLVLLIIGNVRYLIEKRNEGK